MLAQWLSGSAWRAATGMMTGNAKVVKSVDDARTATNPALITTTAPNRSFVIRDTARLSRVLKRHGATRCASQSIGKQMTMYTMMKP